MSGAVNFIHCQSCGFEGPFSTPLVYHDAEKELLLTFFPPELGLPVNEQERIIGPLIKKVMDSLPQEKRKAYLLRPQTMFTFQTLIDRILEADGITKEMIEAQRQRVNLIERLMSTAPESRLELIHQEEEKINPEFFELFSQLIRITMSQGDQNGAQQLGEIQKLLIENTKVGRELLAQAEEAQAAMKALQEASKEGLTREKLLDMIVNAQSEARLNTLVSMARSGMDYEFFGLLSERINKSNGEEQQHLTQLRDQLLEMTRVIDEAMQKEVEQNRKMINEILAAPNLEEAIMQRLNAISDVFIQVLRMELDEARKAGNLEKSAKIQQIADIIQRASTPPEVEFIEALISLNTEEEIQKVLNDNREHLTPEFMQTLTGLVSQSEQQPPEIIEKLQKVYHVALRMSMQANLKK